MNMDKEIKILNLDDILPNRFQPRIQFSDKNISELAESIKEHGVIQPIVVRKISDKYEIIAGERRYKASVLAGKTTIPAIITDLDDKNSAEIALIENVQRQDLTPIEEAVSYKKILDMGYINQTELADKLGKTQSTIANKLRLLNLNDEVQEALLDGKISERHARSLLKLNDKDQVNMLSRIISERLTVRKTDEEVDKMLNNNEGSSDEQKVINNESVVNEMNEEIKNEFNIPTNPIFTEEVKPVEPIQTTEFINPGFMDINKIEQNAEDIFKEVKPADMDSLLEVKTPSPELNSAMAPIPDEIIETKVEEEQPQRGKFFNMFNFGPREENPNFVENVEKEETNMDFGIPKSEPTTFNPFNENEEVEILNPFENKHNNLDNVENTQINNNPFGIESTLSNEEVDTLINVPTAEPETFNPFQNVEFESNIPSTTEFTPTIEPEVQVSEPEEQEELFTSLNTYHLNEDAEFTTKIPVVEIQNEIKNNSIIEDSIPVVEEQESNKYVSDFKTVINTIRECSSTIEKYGYEIEIEELDFEDKYQVIFNIKK